MPVTMATQKTWQTILILSFFPVGEVDVVGEVPYQRKRDAAPVFFQPWLQRWLWPMVSAKPSSICFVAVAQPNGIDRWSMTMIQ